LNLVLNALLQTNSAAVTTPAATASGGAFLANVSKAYF